jgi:NADPH:quinone reductase-like Zn-dependent oxidoreductase
MSVPTTQQQYRLEKSGAPAYELKSVEAPVRMPGANEVLVRVRAASLNRRDIYVKYGYYPPSASRESLVPLSDGAGEVAAVGAGVTRLREGDRVAANFFEDWVDGRSSGPLLNSALGGQRDGMLSQYAVIKEHALAFLPRHLSFEEGATLPCAGVTAWNGLFTRGEVQAGDFVLLQGTGGVSIFGLQLAAAAGAKPIVISSSESKLERAKQLGAFGVVNYKTTPDWEKTVRDITGGAGVNQVLEVGGKDTIARSLASLAVMGHVALIGGLSSFGGDIPVMSLIGSHAKASGIFVGSRKDFDALNAFIEQHQIKPSISRVFEYESAREAYNLMESNDFVGKIVIRV